MSILDDLANELGADVETVRAALLSGGDSESLTPNYLTTDAAGKVGASFTGKITARGLLLPQTSVSSDSRVSWRSDLDNSEMGFAVVQESGGTLPTHNVQGTIQTQGDDSGTTNLSLIAQSQGGSGNVSKIVLDTGLTGGLGIQARVLGITKNILKANGNSDFLQLLTTQKLTLAFGDCPAFGWSGGIHTQVAVPHGLGVVPKLVLTNSGRSGDAVLDDARAPWLTTVLSSDATNFQLLLNTKNNAAIGTFPVPAGCCQWLALG